jgi:hypothetical protein
MASVLSGTVVSLTAHHAFSAEFDADKRLQLKGAVTKVEWTNPHVWIHVDAKKPDGAVETWAIEAGGPTSLFRRGFTKDSLAVGTEILVDGYQSKDGANRMNGREVTFLDGRRLFLGSPGTGAPAEIDPDVQKQPGR